MLASTHPNLGKPFFFSLTWSQDVLRSLFLHSDYNGQMRWVIKLLKITVSVLLDPLFLTIAFGLLIEKIKLAAISIFIVHT